MIHPVPRHRISAILPILQQLQKQQNQKLVILCTDTGSPPIYQFSNNSKISIIKNYSSASCKPENRKIDYPNAKIQTKKGKFNKAQTLLFQNQIKLLSPKATPKEMLNGNTCTISMLA